MKNLRFILTFALAVWVGFAIEILPWVQTEIVKPYIKGVALACGFLIKLFGGSATINGAVIQNPTNGFGVEIANGCSGLEVLILLGAAVVAFNSASIKQRFVGFLMCSVAILSINAIRIISLFYIGQYSKWFFDWAHLYIWDTLIIIDGIVVYILWIRWFLSSQNKAHAVR